MAFFRVVFQIVLGVAFGAASTFALSPAFAAFNAGERPGAGMGLAAFAIIVVAALICGFAPTVRRAFGRGFLVLGAAVFALPLSTFLLSSRAVVDAVARADAETEGAAAIGAGLAGTFATGLAAFVGFFLGAILLVIGLVLVLGGRREVVVVHAPVARVDPRL